MRKAIVAVSALAVFGLSTPAYASVPTLPEGNSLYVVECDWIVEADELQLYSVDPATGVTTEIGTGAGPNDRGCAYQGAQLPGTDWFYFIDIEDMDSLDRLNLVTGEHQEIDNIVVDGTPRNNWVSLSIGPDGSAYIFNSNDLFSLDLETGVATFLSTPALAGSPYGFAYDYVTDKFYVAEDGNDTLVELDPLTGATVELASNGSYWVGSMAFDSEGNLWLNGPGDYLSTVPLADFGEPSAWINSPLLESSGPGTLYSESLWVSFDPTEEEVSEELADTGFGIAPLAALGAFATAGGVALAARRRRV